MISWFGASFVAARLLTKTKEGKDGSETVESKLYRSDQTQRIVHTMTSINHGGGATEQTVKLLQKAYFTDVSEEILLEYLKDSFEMMTVNGDTVCTLLGLKDGFFGDLTNWSSPPPEYIPEDDDDDDDEEEDGLAGLSIDDDEE